MVEAVFRDADVAEVAPCLALGIRGTHALGDQPVDLELEVRLDFVFEVIL